MLRHNNVTHKAARLLVPVVGSLAAVLCGCNPSTLYHKYTHVGNGWDRADTICVESEVRDSNTIGRIYLEVRHTDSYAYTNLGVCVSAESPDSMTVFTGRQVEATLADNSGQWTGEDYDGLFVSSTPAGTMHIGRPGTYTFRICSVMTDSILDGISDIGIRIERASGE